MKKGFTLIELLAVIVVLAIIAVIAVPTILNVVEKARKGAAVSSAYGYIDAVEKYIVMHNIDSTKYPYELNNNTWNVSKSNNDTPALNTIINVKGKKPESGTVTINEKGNVDSAKLVINSYVIECSNKTCTVKGKLVSAKSLNIVDKSVTELYAKSTLNLAVNVDPKDAVVEWTSSDESVATVEDGLVTGKKVGTVTITVTSGSLTDSITLNVGYAVYNDGTAVYYNPETNTKCSESEATSNYATNGVLGTKTGCMKWYTFNDSATSTTVNMILDHNLNTNAAYNINDLTNNISAWAEDVKTTARLISVSEIAEIVGTDFNGNSFAFDSNANSTTKSKYAWLYNYTDGCLNYGCNEGGDYNYKYYGYFTSTSASSDYMWSVNRTGSIAKADINGGSLASCGMRPVITVPKSAIE